MGTFSGFGTRSIGRQADPQMRDGISFCGVLGAKPPTGKTGQHDLSYAVDLPGFMSDGREPETTVSRDRSYPGTDLDTFSSVCVSVHACRSVQGVGLDANGTCGGVFN
jgi:hypothetical protein